VNALEHVVAALEALPRNPAQLGAEEVDLVLAANEGQSEYRRALIERYREIAVDARAATSTNPPPALAARARELADRDRMLVVAEALLDPYLDAALALEDCGMYVAS
jgi:hypothetical protein